MSSVGAAFTASVAKRSITVQHVSARPGGRVPSVMRQTVLLPSALVPVTVLNMAAVRQSPLRTRTRAQSRESASAIKASPAPNARSRHARTLALATVSATEASAFARPDGKAMTVGCTRAPTYALGTAYAKRVESANASMDSLGRTALRSRVQVGRQARSAVATGHASTPSAYVWENTPTPSRSSGRAWTAQSRRARLVSMRHTANTAQDMVHASLLPCRLQDPTARRLSQSPRSAHARELGWATTAVCQRRRRS